MRKIDLLEVHSRDEIAVYVDGLFVETIYHLSPDDINLYGDAGDFSLVRSTIANEAFEMYLDIHDGDYPTKFRLVQDIMEN